MREGLIASVRHRHYRLQRSLLQLPAHPDGAMLLRLDWQMLALFLLPQLAVSLLLYLGF